MKISHVAQVWAVALVCALPSRAGLMPSFLRFGVCSDVEQQPDFDMEQFTGLWYGILRVPNEYSPLKRCITSHYSSVDENGRFKNSRSGVADNNTEIHSEFELMIMDDEFYSYAMPATESRPQVGITELRRSWSVTWHRKNKAHIPIIATQVSPYELQKLSGLHRERHTYHFTPLKMVPLKETIAASFQMLERLAGSQNFIYSLVYGCDDSGDSDRYLDYEDELIDADCSELTNDYPDSSFQFLNEAFQSTDYPTRNTSFDKSLRDHCHESEISEIEIECDANVSSSNSCARTRNKRPHSRSCGCSRIRFVSDSKNSSTSQVSWCEDHDAELLEYEDACSKRALCLMQRRVHEETSSHSRVGINSSYSECCCGVLRNIKDCQLRISKLNDVQEERGTKVLKRNTPEMLRNSSQVNSSSTSKLNVSSAQSGSSPEAFSYEDSTGAAAHDLLNPECSVCFRKHAERDDDVTFSCYGVLPDCQHSFCQCCIASWLQQSAVDRWRCPVCRTSVLFTFVSRLWLPHNTDEKTRQLAGTRTRLLLIRIVLKKTTRLLRFLLFYWTIGVKALRNLIEEITPEFEPLLHRHEIGAFI